MLWSYCRKREILLPSKYFSSHTNQIIRTFTNCVECICNNSSFFVAQNEICALINNTRHCRCHNFCIWSQTNQSHVSDYDSCVKEHFAASATFSSVLHFTPICWEKRWRRRPQPAQDESSGIKLTELFCPEWEKFPHTVVCPNNNWYGIILSRM